MWRASYEVMSHVFAVASTALPPKAQHAMQAALSHHLPHPHQHPGPSVCISKCRFGILADVSGPSAAPTSPSASAPAHPPAGGPCPPHPPQQPAAARGRSALSCTSHNQHPTASRAQQVQQQQPHLRACNAQHTPTAQHGIARHSMEHHCPSGITYSSTAVSDIPFDFLIATAGEGANASSQQRLNTLAALRKPLRTLVQQLAGPADVAKRLLLQRYQ